MGVHNDQAFLGLAEHLRKPHRGKHTAAQTIAEGEARPYGGQLIRVAYQNDPLALGDGQQQAMQQLNIHHAHFVYNHRVALQGRGSVLGEKHFAGMGVDGGFQKAVDGAGIPAGHLADALGGPPGGGGQKGLKPHLAVKGKDTLEDGGLARAGAAGDEQKAGLGGLADGIGLLGGIVDLAVLSAPGQQLF